MNRKYEVDASSFAEHFYVFKSELLKFRLLLDSLPEKEKHFVTEAMVLLLKQKKRKVKNDSNNANGSTRAKFSDLFFTSCDSIPFYVFTYFYELTQSFASESPELRQLFVQCQTCLKRAMEVVNTKYVLNVINTVFLKLLRKYPSIINYKEDLKMESIIGILSALFRYELHHNVKFSTYAFYWVRKYMLQFLLNELKENKNVSFNDRLRSHSNSTS